MGLHHTLPDYTLSTSSDHWLFLDFECNYQLTSCDLFTIKVLCNTGEELVLMKTVPLDILELLGMKIRKLGFGEIFLTKRATTLNWDLRISSQLYRRCWQGTSSSALKREDGITLQGIWASLLCLQLKNNNGHFFTHSGNIEWLGESPATLCHPALSGSNFHTVHALVRY